MARTIRESARRVQLEGLHKQGLRHHGRKTRRGVANGLRCLLGWSARLRVAHRRSLALRAARRRLVWHGALVLLNVQRRKRLLVQVYLTAADPALAGSFAARFPSTAPSDRRSRRRRVPYPSAPVARSVRVRDRLVRLRFLLVGSTTSLLGSTTRRSGQKACLLGSTKRRSGPKASPPGSTTCPPAGPAGSPSSCHRSMTGSS